jgi:dipeptidyl aminopeptidase/acylaminoacyl peptidase
MGNRLHGLLAVFFGVLVCPSLSMAKPVPPTISQLASFPKMSGFSISPDGRHLAALEARGEDRVILVWSTDALNKPPTVIGSSRMKIRGVQFIKHDLLAVSMWQPYDSRIDRLTKTFISKLFITDLAGKNWNEPLPQDRATSVSEERIAALANPTVLDSLPNDPDHILVVSAGQNNGGDVFRVNVRTNRAARILRADDKVAGYVTDLDGNVRARTRADVDATGAYIAAEIREVGKDAWVEHFRSYVRERDTVEVVGFARDPNVAFVLSNVGRDKAVVYEYDVSSRKKAETLFEHSFFDASQVLISRNKGGGAVAFGDILGVRYRGFRGGDIGWVAPAARSIEQTIRTALGLRPQSLRVTDTATGKSAEIEYHVDADFEIVSTTPDLGSVVFAISGDARPYEYYLLRGGKIALLARTYPDIDSASLGKTSFVYYKSRDGLDIPAFITTPNRDLCGPAPWRAVVHPHGGPWARDDLGFDWSMWVPLMVSRCMAVLRPQFRGSAGWGRKLWKAGDAEWGQKMQDDKDDGARWMVEQGIAVKDRIALFGFSYGGYSAMAASVRANGPYKCAIAGAGVSDIKRIWAKFFTNPFFRERQAPTVDGLNPLDHAETLQIPIMVYHGDRDQTVPLEQSQWFVSKAKSRGQPVTYHEIADFGHGPAWTRKIMGDQLGLIEDYLTRGCGGRGL